MSYLDDAVKIRNHMLELKKKEEEEARKKQGAQNAQPPKEEHYDHPSTMENSTATVLYIIVMIVGAIFIDRWLIWIMATFIYLKFITRHSKTKKKK